MTKPPALRIAALVLLTLGWLVLAQPLGAAQGSDAGVRLGFLFNFGKFATWPEGAFASKDAPVHICVVEGDAPMLKALAALDAGEIGGRRVMTRVVGRQGEPKGCHLLYLPAGLLADDEEDLLQKLASQATLTVSDASGFAQRGGMIELVYTDARYQFDVNYLAVKRANLRLSSSLLRLARVVE